LRQGDPTDHVLATIASIFERPAAKPAEPVMSADGPADQPTEPAASDMSVVAAEDDPASAKAETVTDEVEDDTAAEADSEPAAPDEPEAPVEPVAVEAEAQPEPEVAAEPDVDTYHKFGPGPLEELRFKWSARRAEDGRYYVDETIGAKSLPISSGPMPKEAVIAFIDEREREARQRFENLRRKIFQGPSERGETDDTG